MKHFRLVLVLLLLAAVPALAARPYRVDVPAGSHVTLRARQDVLSNKIKASQLVDMVVTSPLRVRGVTIVANGAPAHACVVYSRGSGVGFRGEMMLVVMDMQAVDGSWIPLRAQSQPGDGR